MSLVVEVKCPVCQEDFAITIDADFEASDPETGINAGYTIDVATPCSNGCALPTGEAFDKWIQGIERELYDSRGDGTVDD